MNENGSETFSALVLCGCAALLRDSNAIIKSTHPAGLFDLNESMKSVPKISPNNFSNSRSTPASSEIQVELNCTEMSDKRKEECILNCTVPQCIRLDLFMATDQVQLLVCQLTR
jgi:hypothetical protein